MAIPSANRAAPGPPAGPPAARWKKIDQLLAKDQTATAAPLVEAIYQEARESNDAPAYVRALLYKIRLLENRENDADERAIALLENDLTTATFPARPILHSLLAELYGRYLNQNRYRLYQRTAGAAATADDPANATGGADGGTTLATWDMARLGGAIVRHYRQSVADEPQKQLATPLAALGDLAVGGDAEGRALRPSLFDLLAHRAIEGLQNQELYVTRPEQQFAATDARLYGSASEFAGLKLDVPVADSLNGQFHALQLLQALTAARLAAGPPNAAAVADVDLLRLDYLARLGGSPAPDPPYDAALARHEQAYRALPASAEFGYRRATLALQAGDAPRAVALARAAAAAWPASRGGLAAKQLLADTEQPNLSFDAAQAVVPGQPWRLDFELRNIAAPLHAWAYRVSLAGWKAAQGQGADNLYRRYAKALKNAPAAAWALPVPAQPLDYKWHKLRAVGVPLAAGHYLLVVSNRAGVPTGPVPGAVVSCGFVVASALSAVSRQPPGSQQLRVLALHRGTGALLPGVRAEAILGRPDSKVAGGRRYWADTPAARTDSAGAATLLVPNDEVSPYAHLFAVRLSQGRDTVETEAQGSFPHRNVWGGVQERQTFLFTDRAIYRPGQTLYFKGIATENSGGKARPLTGKAVSLRLMDVNGQTVQTLAFTTSAFGSFQGSVVLPTGLLNGEMSLQTDQASISFAVEDYKRPTFVVALDSVPGRPQPGRELAIDGRARAYAGQATDGAAVRYRVVRRELYYDFYDFGYGGRGGNRAGQEIAHGTARTDADGRFVVRFVPPVPPLGGDGRPGAGFLFEITADVTDAAGETRTGTRTVVLGHNPLSLTLEGPEMLDRQRPQPLRLTAQNATGEPLPATGTLRLLARRYRPSPPGLPGPPEVAADNELPAELVKTQPFDTRNGPAPDLKTLLAGLPTGLYRLEAQAAAPDTAARARHDFTLFDSEASTVPYATAHWFRVLSDSVAPGQPATVLLGSHAAGARILLEVERGGELLRSEWLTLAAGEQRRLRVGSGPATARGPLHVHALQVLDNELYRSEAQVQVAEKPQPLQLSLSTFRDRLQPGQRETWRFAIRQANGQPADAELLATLYDQSLDAFRPHGLAALAFAPDYLPPAFGWAGGFARTQGLELFAVMARPGPAPVQYPSLSTWGALNGGFSRERRYMMAKGSQDKTLGSRGMDEVVVMAAPMADMSATSATSVTSRQGNGAGANLVVTKSVAPPAPDLSAVPTRADFRETALWEPALRTDAAGNAVLEFQMPEAVTRWQLFVLAHDRNLHVGRLARQLVTQKQVQISPNAPRFFRQGDTFTFPAKFSNLTDAPASGTAQLTLLDAATGQDVTAQLLRGPAQQPVSAAARQSAALGWEISLPADFAPVAITYKVVVQTGGNAPEKPSTKKQETRNKKQETYSDGESNTLPVLPNKILVTESLPLPLAGAGTRTFELKKLTSTSSPTRRNYGLTLEMTANPAWYAVQSLPYLMEYPFECSEQVFGRLYANLLAAQILKANPRFKTVLAEWTRQAQNGTAAQKNALESKLSQNQELKNLLLQETPWVRDAQGETERLARLSTLFDDVRLQAETARALAKLQRMQAASGAFPWFERMPDDRYLSQLIVAGFGKLRKLGAFDASQDPAGRVILANALRYLDAALAADYRALRLQDAAKSGGNPSADHLGDLQTQALYARSFWLDGNPNAESSISKPAYTYYRAQAARYWPGRSRLLQGQLALALFRGDEKAPAAQEIMRGLTENALHSPKLGMYWKDVTSGYYWHEAPTETQAVLIEAFDEVKRDQKAVDEMKLWLLKQKQAQHWPSTRATADACYALLLRGSDWLAASPPLQITVGAETVRPAAAQAGTGYFKTTWAAAEITPAQGRVSITKTDPGVAWGALYWQYFEELDQLTPVVSPVGLERQLYRETRTAAGPQLEKLTAAAPLKVGDALVVRLVLRTDQALEYVHLKDQRAAGLEPIGQTSGYRYQNGLGYYESPRDAATNFFISALPRGTHVFEYRLRASQAGDFSGGLSQVQCLYAPEFGGHSAGGRLVIGR